MPLDLFVPGIAHILFPRYAKRPFANGKIRNDVFTKVAYSGVVVTFFGQVISIWSEYDKVGIIAYVIGTLGLGLLFLIF